MKGEEFMKRLLFVCAFLVVPLAGGGFCAGADTAAGDLSKASVGREAHEGREQAKKMRHGDPFDIIAKVLRLSNSQQARIRDIFKADHEEQASIMKQLAENRRLFRDKADAAVFDEAEVRALAEKQGQLMARMIISPALVRSKIRSLLTSEQRDLDERIQPLLESPEHRPHCAGEEFLPRKMEHRPPIMDEEYTLPSEKGLPFCDED
jgi:Spy/CpxP family protein refolding chaperone